MPFLSLLLRPPRSSLFPYTTLFRSFLQALSLFDVAPSEQHGRGPDDNPKGPAGPSLELADAETAGLEFLDERRKDGQEKEGKELKMRSQVARKSEADEHGQRNTEVECNRRENRRGKAQFAEHLARPHAAHQPNGENAEKSDADFVNAFDVVERSRAMQVAISGEAGEKFMRVRRNHQDHNSDNGNSESATVLDFHKLACKLIRSAPRRGRRRFRRRGRG